MQQALELGAKISDLKWAHENRCIIYFDPQLYPDVPLHTLRSDTDGKRFEEWEAARLRLLPKKGDLSLCKNWRGISLLDISSKIFSTILVTRGMKVYEEVGSEEQNGFRCDRGTIDGLFTLRMALCKRREHNIDTWVLFIDLVKAFDSVNHEALFLILQKYGMPDHFINLIIRLHDRAKINLDIGNVDSSIDVSIGVRQGSCEGPMLFLFMMLAAMDTLKMPDHISKPKFMFDDKHGLIGTNYRIKRKTTCFEFFHNLFADDCAIMFESREHLIEGTDIIYAHLKKFGLTMHCGRNGAKSKTEAMYVPSSMNQYDDADTTDYVVDTTGSVHFTKTFKYLGSLVDSAMNCDVEIDARIRAATKAFGALSGVFHDRDLPKKIKGELYQILITTILLYGCETWNAREDSLRKLRTCHRRFIRSILRITPWQMHKAHITSDDLERKLNVPNVIDACRSRLLKWVGKMCLMPETRLPRRMMTCWVRNPRKIGRPYMTWGSTVNNALRYYSIPEKFDEWRYLPVIDNDEWCKCVEPWREVIHGEGDDDLISLI